MKITLESTDKIVTLTTATGSVPARVWEGHTERGIACHAFITRIAALQTDDTRQFEAELDTQRTPSPDIAAYPARLIL